LPHSSPIFRAEYLEIYGVQHRHQNQHQEGGSRRAALPYRRENDIGIMAYVPMWSGIITGNCKLKSKLIS
ncbi:MAG: hypothetical protein P9M00_12415, partial [Candidatus Tritonobacter lacicola]|nr:hypothetical protein [Candidatus Tritonobacter lacicola]